MKVAVDTNVLVRAVMRDNVEQGKIAAKILKTGKVIAVSSVVLCELVWVLRRVYALSHPDIASAIRALISAGNVEVNRHAVEFGLALLEAGGDFADGIIAYEGQWLGGESFISFDKKAVFLMRAQGHKAQLL